MDALKLDGNAAAGILQQVFAVEMTTAVGTCDHCGNAGEIGGVDLYGRGPGMILRCRQCGGVLIKVVTDGERVWLDLRGVRTFELRL